MISDCVLEMVFMVDNSHSTSCMKNGDEIFHIVELIR